MNISKICIKPNTEIIKVIKILKITGKQLLLVVNKKKKFNRSYHGWRYQKINIKKDKTKSNN